MTETDAPIRAKIPFRLRLKAWWNGYDLALRRTEAAAAALKIDDKKHEVHYEAPTFDWRTARIALVQEVWGPGFVGPGGEEAILNLVKPFCLNPAMSLLELGARLGGAARIMADHFGVWVTGLEADSNLVEAGMELSTMAGLAKKAPIKSFDPEHFEVQPKSFDCVFSRDFFFTVEDKDRLLKMIDFALKDRGQLLFTDFVAAEPGRSTPALQEWIAAEPETPHLWTVEDYTKALAALKFDVRIAEDITADLCKQVTTRWASYMAGVDQSALESEAAAALVDEVKFWTRRVKVMEAGDLKAYRIMGLKKQREGLLSDW